MTARFGLPAELAELAGEYEFLGELGRGASAIVYQARDRALGRDVAIKVVHPRPTSPDDDPVARLAREARTVAQLQHPGIVNVYAVRRLHAGGLTLVMQLVPGLTLKATIQQDGPFSPERAELILRDVAAALAYAHGRQIVHRDVKPENIFLDHGTGRALLADFGIARSAESDSLTLTGTAIGTPFYMSPEQVDGRPVDGRSDVYSLGLVAWEMLTGVRPWDGESLYQVIYKQKHDDLPPIEAIRRDVPRRLQYIVERMLQKRPAARWAGADGLLAQLDRTILPADYVQWQATLAGRVARHRAVAAEQRPPDAKTSAPVRLNAATVQFARSAEEWAQSSVKGSASEQNPDGAPDHAVVGAAGQPPDYDTIEPTWASVGPDGAPRDAPTWRRHVVRGAAVVVSAAVAAAFYYAREHSPEADASSVRSASLSASPAAFTTNARWSKRLSFATGQHRSTTSDSVDRSPDLLGLGTRHQCSITPAQSVQCWGDNDAGQFGDGSAVPASPLPRVVAGVMTYLAVGAGGAHTCAVSDSGDVYCWGANESGQLGDGTSVQRSAPVRVGGTGTYRAVRGGSRHTCALDVEGQVRCWGNNSYGQLGNGGHQSQPTPTIVLLPRGAQAVAIAVGARHSCALLGDERVACWGANESGQVGIARDSVRIEPSIVRGVRAVAIAAGDAHTCAALVTGPVRCWGQDSAGQLGSGALTGGAPGRLTSLPAGEEVRALTAGSAHTCALTDGGTAWCWGQSASGSHSAPIRIAGGPYMTLSAAGDRTCGLPPSRAAECWPGAAAVAFGGVRIRPRVQIPTRQTRTRAN